MGVHAVPAQCILFPVGFMVAQLPHSVAVLCETSQPRFALGFAKHHTGCTLSLVAAKGELIWVRSAECGTVAAQPVHSSSLRYRVCNPDNCI